MTDASGTGWSDKADSPQPSAELIFHDAAGAASILAQVRNLPMPLPPDSSVCPDRAHHPYDRCTRRSLSGGSALVIDQGYVDPLAPGGIQQWTAELTTAAGHQTLIRELNASTAQATTATRPTPPLTPSQLTTAVLDKHWRPVLTALPTTATPPRVPSTGLLTKNQIVSTLRTMLPSTFHVSDLEGAEKGYVDLVIDDGHGPGLLTVTDQQWAPKDSKIAEVFKAAKQQADGGRLLTRQVPSPEGAGAVQWEADILYSNGHRLLVTELNSSAYGLTPTRPQPPLSLRQLTTIVRNSSWH
ncbi:hypothetical protein ABZ379_39110 [Streptomyces canus]|uniref:hypothetical protein n=1 Tax=Streptomyces canus TaxID=58343 RepID=UPI0033F41517